MKIYFVKTIRNLIRILSVLTIFHLSSASAFELFETVKPSKYFKEHQLKAYRLASDDKLEELKKLISEKKSI